MHEAERRHVGQMKRPFPETRPVGRSRRAEFRNMSSVSAPRSAESLCVRRIADAEGIEDERNARAMKTP